MSRYKTPEVDRSDDRAAVAAHQWRSERPDLDPFPMQAIGRLFELAQVIARDHLNPVFFRFRLQNGEFDVLATLRRSGPPYALTPTALYEATMISSGGMTARIDRLEKAGNVRRLEHPTDRRGTLVALTDQGKALIDEALTVHLQTETAILAALTEDEQKTLDRLLAKLLASVQSS